MKSAPATMMASVLTSPGTIEYKQVPTPHVGPGQVLVKVTAVGVCGSDRHFYDTGAIGEIVVDGPVILGHETAGVIAAVGEGVDPDRIGERVAVEPQRPCRSCSYCKDGRYHLCRRVEFYGAWPVDGSFAEYALIDSDFAYTVPERVSDEEAALVEPTSVALHAARRAGVAPGARCLVTGAGPIGVLCAQMCQLLGATDVVVSDPSSRRRHFVRAHGATAVIEPHALAGSGFEDRFHILIDASGNAAAIAAAILTVAPGGRIVLVGMGKDYLELPISRLQMREITLTGTYRYVNTWPAAIELISSGRIDVQPLVTERFDLREAETALQTRALGENSIKSIVRAGQ